MSHIGFDWRSKECRAAPTAFFDALDQYARDWHESRLPKSMRDRGISGIRVSRIGESGFTIAARGFELRFGANLGTACEGEVLSQGNGSLVRFHVSLGTPVDLTDEFAEIIGNVIQHAETFRPPPNTR